LHDWRACPGVAEDDQLRFAQLEPVARASPLWSIVVNSFMPRASTSAMRRATVSATVARLALLITRFMVTIVPGRGLVTTTPSDRAIHAADQRRAIGRGIAQRPKVIALAARRPMVGKAGTTY
jgi:hypothetical protein